MRAIQRFVLLALLLAISTRLAQSQSVPSVVFVQAADLQMASVTSQGANGLTHLEALFRGLGARITTVRLDQPIPDDARVVVLVGPRRPLSGEDLARLWIHLGKGNSLLLALDPPGQVGSDAQNGGLDRLLSTEYGVKLLNGLLVEPAFTNETIRDPARSIVLGHLDALANPIMEPLLSYNLPLFLWGARELQAETLALNGSATPLVDSAPAYAETDSRVYQSSKPDPLELNIGLDPQGQLVVGAVAENRDNSSRIAVLGDSEMFENGYGLALNAAGQSPVYAGDYLLAQRLAGWLLNLPPDSWPALPGGMTWINLDGADGDWPPRAAVTQVTSGNVSVLALDITQIRAFRNSDYLYLWVQLASTANPDSPLSVDVDSNLDGRIDGTITLDSQGARLITTDGSETPLPDAAMAAGQGLEVRLPLRVTGMTARLPQVCLSMPQMAFAPQPDCVRSVAVAHLTQQDPAGMRIPDAVVAVVAPTSANLRASPSAASRLVTTLRRGELFAALGRNPSGDWIAVENARTMGWIYAPSITLSGDVQALPVLSSP